MLDVEAAKARLNHLADVWANASQGIGQTAIMLEMGEIQGQLAEHFEGVAQRLEADIAGLEGFRRGAIEGIENLKAELKLLEEGKR